MLRSARTTSMKHEFFVVRQRDGYVLADERGDLWIAARFIDEAAAADAAIRFAQADGALYSIQY